MTENPAGSPPPPPFPSRPRAEAVWLRHVLGKVARDFVLEPTEAKLVRRALGQTGGDEPDSGLTRDSSSAGSVTSS